jgi:hypothetical protein
MARNPRISFVPNGKNSKMIPGYFLKPNYSLYGTPPYSVASSGVIPSWHCNTVEARVI